MIAPDLLRFLDRADAGRQLARALEHHRDHGIALV